MNKFALYARLVVLFAALFGFVRSELLASPAVAPDLIRLDPNRPVHATQEVCNPVDPLVIWDVVFSNVEVDAGCKSFTATDQAPGVRFMVVKGDHSLTVRYPTAHSPIVTGAYDKVVNGVPARCVTVSMPHGLMLQKRVREEAATAVEDAEPNQVLTCSNSPRCTLANGECCCSSPSCSCFICKCALGCADCTCDGEDGGIWSADPFPTHPRLSDDGWRKPRHGHAELQLGGSGDE